MEKLQLVIKLMNDGGTLGWAVAVAGGFAILCALFVLFGSLLRAPSKVVRFLAMMCLFLSLATSAIGVAITLMGRQATLAAANGKRASAAERIQREGFIQARSGVTLAVPLAAPPILFALLGLAVAARRRWGEYHEEPPSGLGLAVLLILVDSALVGAGVYLYRQPAPGKELDDDGWRVRELTDSIDANEWNKCLETKWELPAGSAAQGMGAHADNQKRCVDHFVAEGKPEELKTLAEAKWLDDPKLKAAIAEKLGAAPKEAPKAEAPPAAAPPPPSGAADIAEVQAKAKACYDKAAKKKPKLTVSTTFALEIAKDGKITSVKDTGKGKPDEVRKCALKAVKGLKLKASEARKLEVPLSFP